MTARGRVTALALHAPEAVRTALVARGMPPVRADAAAAGLRPAAFLLAVDHDERELLVAWALRSGLDALSGEGWVLVAGSAARLAGLARPAAATPAELSPLLHELGQALGRLTDPPRQWTLGNGCTMDLTRPCLVGVLNVTPDSFSDGGKFQAPERATAHAARLKAQGAHLLDVGGESTRPGAAAVTPEEERRRVLPVIERLVADGLGPVSVDTRRAVVARAAIEAGAVVVNDVSALTHDPAMADAVAAANVGVILMHMRGTPETMDRLTDYRGGDVAADVAAELDQRLAEALERGIAEDRIVLDPGLGFAKTADQSFRLLDALETIVALGRPVLIGPSRKRFLAAALGRVPPPPPEERDGATAAACVAGWLNGARLFRVHDVARAREALAVAAALGGGGEPA